MDVSDLRENLWHGLGPASTPRLDGIDWCHGTMRPPLGYLLTSSIIRSTQKKSIQRHIERQKVAHFTQNVERTGPCPFFQRTRRRVSALQLVSICILLCQYCMQNIHLFISVKRFKQSPKPCTRLCSCCCVLQLCQCRPWQTECVPWKTRMWRATVALKPIQEILSSNTMRRTLQRWRETIVWSCGVAHSASRKEGASNTLIWRSVAATPPALFILMQSRRKQSVQEMCVVLSTASARVGSTNPSWLFVLLYLSTEVLACSLKNTAQGMSRHNHIIYLHL